MYNNTLQHKTEASVDYLYLVKFVSIILWWVLFFVFLYLYRLNYQSIFFSLTNAMQCRYKTLGVHVSLLSFIHKQLPFILTDCNALQEA